MESTKVKLSFIVPIYNVEKYLCKCVDSLLAQDYDDYEIILVDDGSPDKCPDICDQYAAEHDNVRVVHRTNGGLSDARNSGIAIANGEYICFIDSDDYWEPNVLGGLMKQMKCENLDVLRFKYQNVNERYEVFNPYKRDARLENDYSTTVVDGVSFLNQCMNTGCYVNMFILRRLLLRDCLFTPGLYFEDTDWTPRMLCKAKRVASTDIIVYNYLIRRGSISNAVDYKEKKKVINDKIYLIKSLQKQVLDLKQNGKDTTWFSRMIADIVISVIGMLSVDFYNERQIYLDELAQLDVYPIDSTLYKAKLINFSPKLAIKLLHLKNMHI